MGGDKKKYVDADAFLDELDTDVAEEEAESRSAARLQKPSPAFSTLSGSNKVVSGVKLERLKSQEAIEKVRAEAQEEIQAAKEEALAAKTETEALKAQLETEKQTFVEKLESLESGVGGASVLELTMPVTKQLVTFRLEEIDPKLIDISPENEREQEFLDEVSLRDILPDIKKYGQQKPGTVRPKKGGRFELIEGSRRRKSCEIAGVKFKAFVGDVPDADVRVLSVSENIKKDVSPYEKGVAYKKQIDAAEYENWTQLAAAKGISTSHASRLKALAELPVRFIKILPTPSAMSTKYGEEIGSLMKKDEAALDEKVEELLEMRDSVSSPKDYPDYEEIVKALKSAVRSKIKKPKQNEPQVYESKCGEYFLKHSVTNKGATKFELDGVSDQQVAKIVKVIGKELKLIL